MSNLLKLLRELGILAKDTASLYERGVGRYVGGRKPKPGEHWFVHALRTAKFNTICLCISGLCLLVAMSVTVQAGIALKILAGLATLYFAVRLLGHIYGAVVAPAEVFIKGNQSAWFWGTVAGPVLIGILGLVILSIALGHIGEIP